MNNVNEQWQCSFDPLASHIIIIVIVSLPIIPIHFSGIVRVVFSSSEDLTRGHSTRVAPLWHRVITRDPRLRTCSTQWALVLVNLGRRLASIVRNDQGWPLTFGIKIRCPTLK